MNARRMEKDLRGSQYSIPLQQNKVLIEVFLSLGNPALRIAVGRPILDLSLWGFTVWSPFLLST